MPVESIERREVAAQPILFVRHTVARDEIAQVLGASLGKVFGHCQQAGLTIVGKPFTRYPAAGDDGITLEAGIPIAESADGKDDIQAGTLHAGPVVVALHTGPYENLHEAYSALETWLSEQSVTPAGAPWEVYVTDPGAEPNPAAWQTEVYWPIQ